MSSFRKSSTIAALAGALFATNAVAQDMRDRLHLNIPEYNGLATEVGHFPRGAPGTSSGSPIAFGANWGDAFVGVGYQTPIRYGTVGDGGATIGMGFLNARTDMVGLEVDVSPLSTFRSGVGNRVGFGAKLHTLLNGRWGVAVGVQNIVANKNPDDGNPAVYAVVSKVMDLDYKYLGPFKTLTLSGGLGNESFRLERDIRENNKTVGFFGSAALRVQEWGALIADWNQDLTMAFSFVPFHDLGLVLTPGIADLTGSAGTHNRPENVRPRFTLGAGFGVHF